MQRGSFDAGHDDLRRQSAVARLGFKTPSRAGSNASINSNDSSRRVHRSASLRTGSTGPKGQRPIGFGSSTPRHSLTPTVQHGRPRTMSNSSVDRTPMAGRYDLIIIQDQICMH